MSASLVGSEMCIRDRPETLVSETQARKRRNRPKWASKHNGIRRVQHRRCLLYTSDAADDM
eukprot:4015899-Alexandrium_andersonii.AAC.1